MYVIRVSDMTQSCDCRDSFIWVARLIHMRDATHSLMCAVTES